MAKENIIVDESVFFCKNEQALKEASETEYWIDILYQTQFLNDVEYTSIHRDVIESNRILTSIVNTSRKKV